MRKVKARRVRSPHEKTACESERLRLIASLAGPLACGNAETRFGFFVFAAFYVLNLAKSVLSLSKDSLNYSFCFISAAAVCPLKIRCVDTSKRKRDYITFFDAIRLNSQKNQKGKPHRKCFIGDLFADCKPVESLPR